MENVIQTHGVDSLEFNLYFQQFLYEGYTDIDLESVFHEILRHDDAYGKLAKQVFQEKTGKILKEEKEEDMEERKKQGDRMASRLIHYINNVYRHINHKNYEEGRKKLGHNQVLQSVLFHCIL
ncbi:hypothetical protein Dimus_025100 [Dionaea muscipula]